MERVRFRFMVRALLVVLVLGGHVTLYAIDRGLETPEVVRTQEALPPAAQELTQEEFDRQVDNSPTVAGSTNIEPLSYPTDSLSWLRESYFLSFDTSQKQGVGHILVEKARPAASGAIRILAVSDSTLWGTGRGSVDAVWSRQLEVELNRRHGNGTHTVRTLARVDSSLLDYAEWLTSELIEEYDPDVIVIGFVENDPIPSGYERILCPKAERCPIGTMSTLPAYQRCIAGGDGVVGWLARNVFSRLYPNLTVEALRRQCDAGRIGAEVGFDEMAASADPALNPYRDYLPQAARTIVEHAAGRPVLLMPTPHSAERFTGMAGYLDLLKVDGLQHVAIPRTEAVLPPSYEDKSYWSMPIDPHPSEGLSRQYALDLADTVDGLKLVQPSSAAALSRPLISNATPASLTATESAFDVVDVFLSTPERLAGYGVRYQSTAGLLEAQFVPCAHMGRPHIRLDIDQLRGEGRDVGLRLVGGTVGHLTVLAVSYTKEGLVRPGPLLSLQVGEQLVVAADVGVDHFLIGTTTSGCQHDAELTMPALHVQLRLL